MKWIHTALSPNVQKDDLWLSIRLLCAPWRWKRGVGAQKLEQYFTTLFPNHHAFSFANGRTSLLVLLEALGLGKGDEVLLQAYTCVAVPEPIVWTKATPVYVDCDRESLTMSLSDLKQKITAKSKVLILQHTFGNQCDLEHILAFARERGLFVIEDCAHALGGRFHGALLGSFGDAAFFSFGRDKMLSSVFGGMLVVRDDALADRIRCDQRQLSQPSYGWIGKQLLHPLLTTIAKKTYGICGIGKILLGVFRHTHLISLAVDRCERRGEKPDFVGKQLSHALASLALHQCKKLEVYTKHRQMIAQMYEKSFSHTQPQILLRSQDPGVVWLRFPIRVPAARRFLASAFSQGLICGDWYSSPIAPEGVDTQSIGYERESCPTAEQLTHEIVNLPTHIGIEPSDAQRIIQFVQAYESAY